MGLNPRHLCHQLNHADDTAQSLAGCREGGEEAVFDRDRYPFLVEGEAGHECFRFFGRSSLRVQSEAF